MNKKTILWLTISSFLLFASGFSLYIAAYNWWAADFRSEYSQAYASRGNEFFVLALILFAAPASVVVAVLRWRRRQGLAKT
jgi:H+/Cl- antiporter ClcA